MRLSDEQYAGLAASGDDAAMEELALRCYPRIHAFCLKLSRSPHEAQDLAQAVMIRMIERIHQYRAAGGAKFTSWLYRIAYNQFIDATRRKHPIPAGDGLLEARCDPDDPYQRVDDASEAQQLLSVLSDELRAMVVLRYYMDMGHEEIAGIMKTSPKRVKWRLNDAMERMRREKGKVAYG